MGNAYAARWPVFLLVFFVLAFAVLGSDEAGVQAVGQVCVIFGVFVSGFCYRERLRQLNRRPPWPFRSMVEKS